MVSQPNVRVGIGGWSFPPWRSSFYPEGLRHADELGFASRAVTAIEINATYHRLQKPENFAAWAQATPDDFIFAIKASRYVTSRRNLGEAEEAIDRFLAQGITELGGKLGPVIWQLPATKRFEPEEITAFLALLPREYQGIKLRHAIQARNESFRDAEFGKLMRKAGVATVFAQSDRYPTIAADTADFFYIRLENTRADERAGYSEAELDSWAVDTTHIAGGRKRIADLGQPRDGGSHRQSAGQSGFVFIINGAKERAPAAAVALLKRLQSS